ncbi:hypothetical protein LIPSTDRAFT_27913, partial [Lipomyces starkeyi NRRL Y-11557]
MIYLNSRSKVSVARQILILHHDRRRPVVHTPTRSIDVGCHYASAPLIPSRGGTGVSSVFICYPHQQSPCQSGRRGAGTEGCLALTCSNIKSSTCSAHRCSYRRSSCSCRELGQDEVFEFIVVFERHEHSTVWTSMSRKPVHRARHERPQSCPRTVTTTRQPSSVNSMPSSGTFSTSSTIYRWPSCLLSR